MLNEGEFVYLTVEVCGQDEYEVTCSHEPDFRERITASTVEEARAKASEVFSEKSVIYSGHRK